MVIFTAFIIIIVNMGSIRIMSLLILHLQAIFGGDIYNYTQQASKSNYNKISTFKSTGGNAFGIYSYNYPSTAYATYSGDSASFINNSISDLFTGGSSGQINGIYCYCGKGHKFFYNSINLSGAINTSGLTTSLYLGGLATPNNMIVDSMFNNNFSNTLVNAGTSKTYAVYTLNGTASFVTFKAIYNKSSNYNNFYSFGNTKNIMAFWNGADKAAITDWEKFGVARFEFNFFSSAISCTK